MKLNRRQFFKALGAGAVVIGTPKVVNELIEIQELWKPKEKTISIVKTPNLVYGEKFAYDPITKNIKYIGPKSESATVLELHRWLQDQADNITPKNNGILGMEYPVPSSRATDNIISLHNGWNIDDYTAQYLSEGSISQDNGNTLYTGIKTIGTMSEGSIIYINGKPAVRPGHVNQCVHNKGGAVTITQKTPGMIYCSIGMTPQQGVNYAAIFEQQDLYYDPIKFKVKS
jgi:hypothetical protein